MNNFQFNNRLICADWRLVIVLVFLPMICLLSACHSTSKNGDSRVENFERFYMKFHSDSLFQLSRIPFPIEGLPSFAESETFDAGTFKWELDTWDLHHAIDYEEFPDITQRVVKQKTEVAEFVDMGSGFGLERKFELRNKKWYLVYYVGINKLKKE